jgi:hypothetical protein
VVNHQQWLVAAKGEIRELWPEHKSKVLVVGANQNTDGVLVAKRLVLKDLPCWYVVAGRPDWHKARGTKRCVEQQQPALHYRRIKWREMRPIA